MAQPDGSGPVLPRAVPEAVDGAVLRRWLALAEDVAAEVRDLVDSLNVFPVPDADTGTNVLLTLRSARDALARLPRAADAAQVSRAAADGAVRGARGNSGLLISQALAALADICAQAPDPSRLRPVELVAVYERMASTTWAAISRPVTGTLLSVARDAAAAARAGMEESAPSAPATVGSIASAAAFGAQESVVETAGLGHGPVDAGGAALMLLLTCLSDTIETSTDGIGSGPPAGRGEEGLWARAPYTAVARQMIADLAEGGALHGPASPARGVSSGEFEVMYLLEATAAQAEQLRHDLEALGDSVGVVGTPDALGVGLYQVHVHTDTPRAALPRQGSARQICIHHLHPTALVMATAEPPSPWGPHSSGPDGRVVSFERLAARRAERKAQSVRTHPSQAAMPRPAPPVPAAARAGAAGLPAAPARDQGVGVIACTRAPGLIEQLARSGAAVVLDPDRDGIVRAAGDLGAPQAIVLPCDPACTEAAHEAARLLAARSAAASAGRPAAPGHAAAAHAAGESGSQQPEGIQLLVCDTDDEARVLAAAVAVAGRSGQTEVSDLARRAWSASARLRTIGLSGAQAEPEAVARTIASALRPDDELLTVITGRHAGGDVGVLAAGAAGAVSGVLEADIEGPASAGGLEVAVHAGGQESPDVLIAIE
ncbi:DAK2 domain-containing protein [Actinomyces bowdenii]|uniref:DAK2 domain-containing protein n=1 Tax=Actinomyces bowdenii TaxID=131109 RepID=A0A3P1V831_9ACTO|nr:DAK2 domain-containing protein [Actinomyces bowdenii]RRD29660.1 DAK2 domain-containing protein [Actinomyces bowdenii]